jgi:diguanylate cyclase (GGDEF)-like protein/PAS domain S-box-containing protein
MTDPPSPVDLERRLREAELFIRINTAAAHGSPVAVLSTICREVAQAIGVPGAGFGQLDADGRTLTVIAEHRAEGTSAMGVQFTSSNPLTRAVIETRKPVIVGDVNTDERLADSRSGLQALGICSMMIVPVIAHDEVIGTLGLDAYTPHEFTPSDVNLVSSVIRAAVPVLEQTRLFAQLQSTLERYERLVGSVEGVVWESTWNGRMLECTYVSPQIESMLGYPREDFLGPDDVNAWERVEHAEDRPRVHATMHAVIADLQPRAVENRVITKDGRELWISDRISGWRDGDRVFLRGLMRDVTEHKRAARLESDRNAVLELVAQGAELNVTLERLRLMAETQSGGAPNAVFLFDQSDFEMVNAVGLPADLMARLQSPVGHAFLLSFAPEKKRLRAGEVLHLTIHDPRVSAETRQAMRSHPQHVALLPVRSSAGALLAAMMVFHDEDQLTLNPGLRAVMDLLSIALERSKLLRTLEFQAKHDQLTQLPNRVLYHERLEEAMRRADDGGGLMGLLNLDLDGFKRVNDRFGHIVGDELLVGLTEYLRGNLDPRDTLARLGGDEFAIVVHEIQSRTELLEIAGRVQEFINAFRLENGARVTASIGAAIYPSDATRADDLYRVADEAMYLEKDATR